MGRTKAFLVGVSDYSDIGTPAGEEVRAWVQANISLFSTIHDFTLLYNDKYRNNRETVMKSTVLRYYADLKTLLELEKMV